MKTPKNVERRSNLAAHAVYYKEISRLFSVLAKLTEKQAKKQK